MKYDLCLWSACLLLLVSMGYAQTKEPVSYGRPHLSFSLTIRLLSDEGEGIPFTKVMLMRDSLQLLSSKVTGPDGRTTFHVADSLNGKLRIHIKTLGYEEFSSSVLFVDSANAPEQAFRLKKIDIQLAEVEIFQKRIISEGEKLIYHIRQDQFSAATSMAELFTKMPGLVLSSGELKLNGKSGVLILIDGKGELKGQEEQLMMLAGLSSDQVEKVEIISSPSAKYNANINAVINVITKKVKGFSNFRSGYSQPFFADGKDFGLKHPSGSTGTNLNFLLGKVRTALFFHMSNQRGLENSSETRSIRPLSRYLGNSYSTFSSFSLMPNISFDYDLHKRSSVALNVDFGLNPSYQKKTDYHYLFFDYANNQLDSTVRTSNTYTSDSWRTRLTGSYKYKMDTLKNSFLYLHLIYSSNPYTQHHYLFNQLDAAPLSLAIASHLKGQFEIYSASLIFSNLVKKKFLSTEAGLKFNSLENETMQQFNQESFDFRYSEQLSALFLTARWNIGRYTLTTEFRNEFLQAVARFKGGQAEEVSHEYFKIYPQLLLQRPFGSHATASLGYSKRVRRPPSVYMNPSQAITNYYYRHSGNLAYLPGYSDRIEGQLRYRNFGATLYMDHSIHQRVMLPTSDPYVFQGLNSGKFNSYGASLNYSLQIQKWFSSNNSIDLSHTAQGQDDYVYSRDQWGGFNVASSNDFTLGKRTRLQVGLYYSSNSYSAYGVFGRVFSSSIDLKQLFFKDKLSFNMTIEDPFGIKKLRSSSDYPMQSQQVRQLTNNRILYFQLLYKFRFGRNFTKQGFKDKNDGEIRY